MFLLYIFCLIIYLLKLVDFVSYQLIIDDQPANKFDRDFFSLSQTNIALL